MKRLPDYFSHTFVINLPERKDRFNRVAREFQKLGYCIDGPEAPVTVFPALKFDYADGFPSVGFRGSFSSHLAVLELAKRMNLRNVLICEDDVQFTNTPAELVNQILKSVPEEWDIIYFGYYLSHDDFKKPAGLWPYANATIGGHCYAVNGTFFDELIGYMKACRDRAPGHPDGGRMGRDATFNQLRVARPQTNVFLSSPVLAVQGSSASSVSPSWFDRPPIAPLAHWLRLILRG